MTSDKLKEAFYKADAENLANFFDEKVKMVFEGRQNIYTAHQAEFIMKDFFTKNKPQKANFIYKGQRNNFIYAYCHYKSNSKDYQIYLVIKKNKDNYIVESLNIDVV